MADSSIAQLTRALVDGNRHERAVAAIHLGELGASEALERLTALVSDPDPIVSIAAIYACWRLGVEDVDLLPIIYAVSSGAEELVQQAAQTIEAIGNDLLPTLLMLVQEGGEPALLALDLMLEVGTAQAREAVEQLPSINPAVSQRAAAVLADWDE